MKRLLTLGAGFGSDLRLLLCWAGLSLPVGIVVGLATAFFLWALDGVIALHLSQPWLLWLLPLIGVGVSWLYLRYGKGSEAGHNLLLDEIHEPGGGVPARMAPLVLLGTLATHLGGGSAGREGTAVQMGGSLAGLLARLFKVGREHRRIMLMCGIAAGFGAVFGTPLAGAVFAMEVLVVGRLQYDALVPVLMASVVGDATCAGCGILHTPYHLDLAVGNSHAWLSAWLLVKIVIAGICFGLLGRLFAELTHAISRLMARHIEQPLWRPAVGGMAIIAMTLLLGSHDYLGLGVSAPPGGSVSILAAFTEAGATSWSWLWKSLFTAVTVASGFKGGEVTPLFFIGATFGHALGHLLHEPVALMAALGFVAVFAGASNTPLACTLMGMELFGAQYGVGFGVACFVAYFASGHSGIYLAQKLGVSKTGRVELEPVVSLREVRQKQAGE